MAVTKVTQEIKVRVSAKRMFKALVTESYTLLPKIMPHIIKSIDILQGDGGAGTIKQMNMPDGAPHDYTKMKVDSVDADKLETSYTLIEGSVLGDKVESVYYVQKFNDTGDGGCIITLIGEYRTKGAIQLKEEEVKVGREPYLGYYTATEEYLLANPDVCA